MLYFPNISVHWQAKIHLWSENMDRKFCFEIIAVII